ncbi:hypothetical protein [Niveibacterium terrae]|uniref:hypothetical protein n=1 Tax=Niveibacterium terrae TaxID=3373598 RepID=UPI003A91BD8E
MSITRSIAMLLSAFALLAAVPAQAAPPRVLGLDDMSCSAWARSKDDAEQRGRFIAWARGFLSGHNYARQAQQVSDVSNGTVEMFVTRYCNEHAKSSVNEAAQRMSDLYSGRNAPITK